ncbi:hypothetical protein C0J52_02023 [Blattella germanica]|nr:hypothetical protein C0J52_02023 [Blattella germanica]
MITSASLRCFLCKHVSTSENSDFILCTECQQWFHGSCVNLCNDAVKTVSESNSSWTCLSCKSNGNSIPNPDISQSDLIPCPQCADSSKLYKGVGGLRIHWAKAHSNENFIGNLSSSVTQTNILDAPAFSSRLASKSNIQVLQRIPKGARSFSADKLSHLLDLCISTNTVESWQNLFLFAYIALRIPDQSSNKQGRSLVSKIKDNVSTFTLQSPQHHDRSPTFSKSRLVQAKVADGDLFYSFFKSLVGKDVVVELKNDLSICGTLHSVDQYLNIKLTDISVTDPDKYPHMLSVKNCFIRGSVVRYVQLPADEVDTQLLQDAARKEAAVQSR